MFLFMPFLNIKINLENLISIKVSERVVGGILSRLPAFVSLFNSIFYCFSRLFFNVHVGRFRELAAILLFRATKHCIAAQPRLLNSFVRTATCTLVERLLLLIIEKRIEVPVGFNLTLFFNDASHSFCFKCWSVGRLFVRCRCNASS